MNQQLPPALSAKNKECVAYLTFKDRKPIIVAKIADSLNRNKATLNERFKGPNSDEDLKNVIGAMSMLRHEIMTNKPAVPLKDAGPDAIAWNLDLERQVEINGGEPFKWFDSPWLWMECYLYRRVHEAVLMSSSYQTLDVFEEQKQSAFKGSYESISIMTTYLYGLIKGEAKAEEEVNEQFKEFLLMSLWGNKCDLSISAGHDNNPTENPLDQLVRLMPYVLVNDANDVLRLLRDKQKSLGGKGAKISYILDNAGFEFMTDLCLAEFLLSSGLASSIQFHGKAIPWFVSDVTEADVAWVLQQMASVNHEAMNGLSQIWRDRLQDGTMTFQYNPFWTLPYPFCEMASLCPDLYSKLSQSDLIIFKGDLNYRKLVSDLKWDTTASFSDSLRGFHPSAVCSLRTVKADVVVGLKPGQAEEVQKKDASWMVHGNWAVISLACQ